MLAGSWCSLTSFGSTESGATSSGIALRRVRDKLTTTYALRTSAGGVTPRAESKNRYTATAKYIYFCLQAVGASWGAAPGL